MARDLATRSALSLQEQLFVERALETGDTELAYAQSGFATASPQWRSSAATLARKPAVVAALHTLLARQLALDAASARRVALALMNDPAIAAKVRADLAIKIMRMAGHVEPKQAERDTTSDKSLAELSMSELRDRAEALERELSERARPIISAKATTISDEAIDIIEEH